MRVCSLAGIIYQGLGSYSDLGAGGTDQGLAQIIRRGIANTLLSHSFRTDKNVWQLLAYLKTLNVGAAAASSIGNADSGKTIFANHCSSCHQVNGNAGEIGPDLSNIRATRFLPLLAQKIRHASSYIMSAYSGGFITNGYEPVTLVTERKFEE